MTDSRPFQTFAEIDARLCELKSRLAALNASQARRSGDVLRAELLEAESSLLALRAGQIESDLRSERAPREGSNDASA